jgi:hypothetical protein
LRHGWLQAHFRGGEVSCATYIRKVSERLGQRAFQELHANYKIVDTDLFLNDEQFYFIAMVEPKDSSRITKGKIDEAITALKDIKPKERDSVSDREAIRKMKRYIEKLTSSKYGYTYDEVSLMLKGLGINLSGGRIKYLLGELKKSTRRRQKTFSSENSSTLSNPATETEQPLVNKKSENILSETQKLPATRAKSQRKNQQSATNAHS